MEIHMKEKDNKELEELTADMPKKKLPVWSKIVIGVVIALLAILGIAYGVFRYNYGKIYVKDNALGHCAGKLVRVIWKMLTDEVEFNLE